MVNLATRMRFVAALSWHTDASKLLSPYTIPGVKNPTPDVAWSVAETLLEAMAENIEHAKLNARNDRELRRYERFRVAKALYKVDGTDQDWHFHAHGTLAYIFEGTHQNPADNAVRLTSIAVQRPLFGALADRVLDSSMIHGVVRDATGDPVAGAVVTIDGYQRGDAGEEWTSRYDGRYTRIALKPGSYTVRAHNGEQAGEARVTVGSTPTKVDIRMSKPHAP